MTPDASRSLVDHLPPRLAPWARLARLDRPAGIWLLFWPCVIGLLLSRSAGALLLLPWFLLGAVAMRAAGCVWNDILDRDLDRRVARTAQRPIASGAISVRAGLAFAVALSLVGLLVLVQLPRLAQLIALSALLPVAVYPLMKRLTWWPQAWLGLTFNWGVAVGWACGPLPADWRVMALVWAGLLFWTIGYDSIYAAQDREDDALVGIRSSARRLGRWLKPGVALFYALALAFLGLAAVRLAGQPLALLALLPAALHMGWQVATLRPDDPANALARFRANVDCGLLLVLAFAAIFPSTLPRGAII